MIAEDEGPTVYTPATCVVPGHLGQSANLNSGLANELIHRADHGFHI